MRVKFDAQSFSVLLIAAKQFSQDPKTSLLESRKIISEIAKEFEKKNFAKSVSLQYMGALNGQKHFVVNLSNSQILAFDTILRFWAGNNEVLPEFKLSELQTQINKACLSI